MIDPSIDLKALTKAIGILKKSDAVLSPEFVKAGQQTVDYVVKDLKKGVGTVTGELQRNITGEVKNVIGVQSQSLFEAMTSPYNYAGRLDKDGSLRWRSGKFKSYRTFGWWTSVIPKLVRNQAKKFYTKAVERGVVIVAAKIKSG